ncbi:hypothetical protein KOI35_14280 [Actinoplanes bogorensis]|uniref:Uncharacterized protein n=1 Tax=Paractinoplanes bogorensis TaxID=1610840 RepID=A0ABS5YMJ4_9ACTN|nr:hypothetical protein [Actinoplanes bogorensis]MBU2664667.1 hypothetical protein [Actinoplanes bogorensis]
MPDPLFRRLFAETENTAWESVHRVRSRARRRTSIGIGAVGAVVAIGLVAGGVAIGSAPSAPVAGPPLPAPSPSSPSSSPSPLPSGAPSPPPSTAPPPSWPPATPSSTPPADVTPAMMLQPSDVGAGYVPSAVGTDGDWSAEFTLGAIGCLGGSKPEAVTGRVQSLRKGPEVFVLQETTVTTPGGAAAYLADVTDRVRRCKPAPGQSVRIADTDFAGDESVLLVFHLGAGSDTKIVLAFQDDLLTEIFVKPNPSDTAIRKLGVRAVARF